VADDSAVLLVDAGQETRNVDERDERDVERIAGAHEARRFLARLDVEHSGEHHRLVADDADGVSVDAREAAHDALGPVGEVLEEFAAVDHLGDHLLHVVRHVRRRREDRAQRFAAPRRVVGRFAARWLAEIVLRQERQQIAHVGKARLLVCRHETRHAAL